MKIPDSGHVEFKDMVHGKVRFQNSVIDDQVILKNDGFPTYHFANIVDDYMMGITHVIRGEVSKVYSLNVFYRNGCHQRQNIFSYTKCLE